MTITLYELVGENRELSFSPHCWKTRFALAHKGLEAARVPIGFSEKETIAFSGQPLVPVITDDDNVINDSWAIAEYLEEAYPDRPSLFGSDAAKALAQSINEWVNTGLAVHLRKLVIMPIYQAIPEHEKAYFREDRERKLGMTLEAFDALADGAVEQVQTELASVRELLSMQPYLGGGAPNYADIAMLGTFMWVRCTSPRQFLSETDIVNVWYENMLDQYHQLGRNAVTAYC